MLKGWSDKLTWDELIEFVSYVSDEKEVWNVIKEFLIENANIKAVIYENNIIPVEEFSDFAFKSIQYSGDDFDDDEKKWKRLLILYNIFAGNTLFFNIDGDWMIPIPYLSFLAKKYSQKWITLGIVKYYFAPKILKVIYKESNNDSKRIN